MNRLLLAIASILVLGTPAPLAAAHAPAVEPCAEADLASDACGALESQCGPPFPCCYVDPATGVLVCCFRTPTGVRCVAVLSPPAA